MQCGHPTETPRLTVRGVLRDTLEHVIEFDVPLLRTVRDLSWRPGWVCDQYVIGRRRDFTNPLKYCFLAGALVVAAIQLMGFGVNTMETLMNTQFEKSPPNNPDAAAATLNMARLYDNYLHIFYFAALPLLAFLLWLTNHVFNLVSRLTVKKRCVTGDRNFAELLVMCLYVYGHVFVIQFGCALITKFVWSHLTISLISQITPFMMLTWALKGFCRMRFIWALLIGVVVTFVYFLIAFIAFFVGGVGAQMLYHKMTTG